MSFEQLITFIVITQLFINIIFLFLNKRNKMKIYKQQYELNILQDNVISLQKKQQKIHLSLITEHEKDEEYFNKVFEN